MLYLIVSIPDLCTLAYFDLTTILNKSISGRLRVFQTEDLTAILKKSISDRLRVFQTVDLTADMKKSIYSVN